MELPSDAPAAPDDIRPHYVSDNDVNFFELQVFTCLNISFTDQTLDDEQFFNRVFTVAAVLFTLLTVVGIVGNSLVAYVIITNKPMRNVINLLLLNLSFADIAFLLVCGPFGAYKYISQGWTLGSLTCQIIQYVLYVTVYVTIYTLVAISAYRYLTIVRACSSQVIVHQRRTFQFIGALWLCIMVLNIPTLLVHTLKHQASSPSSPLATDYTYCGIEASSVTAVFVSFFAFGYALPLTVIASLNFMIVRFLCANRPAAVLQQVSAELRTTRTCRVIATVVVAFGISWLPHHVNSLLALFDLLPDSHAYLVLRVVWLCMSFGNSCVNPFIYNYGSREFRESFRRVFGCRGRRESSSGPGLTSPGLGLDAAVEMV